MKTLETFLTEQFNMLDRGIVATPTAEYLEEFTKANHGSADFLLMQLSKNFGYKLALEEMKNQLLNTK